MRSRWTLRIYRYTPIGILIVYHHPDSPARAAAVFTRTLRKHGTPRAILQEIPSSPLAPTQEPGYELNGSIRSVTPGTDRPVDSRGQADLLHLAHTVGFRVRHHGFSLAGRSVADNVAAADIAKQPADIAKQPADHRQKPTAPASKRPTGGRRVGIEWLPFSWEGKTAGKTACYTYSTPPIALILTRTAQHDSHCSTSRVRSDRYLAHSGGPILFAMATTHHRPCPTSKSYTQHHHHQQAPIRARRARFMHSRVWPRR